MNLATLCTTKFPASDGGRQVRMVHEHSHVHVCGYLWRTATLTVTAAGHTKHSTSSTACEYRQPPLPLYSRVDGSNDLVLHLPETLSPDWLLDQFLKFHYPRNRKKFAEKQICYFNLIVQNSTLVRVFLCSYCKTHGPVSAIGQCLLTAPPSPVEGERGMIQYWIQCNILGEGDWSWAWSKSRYKT